MEIGEHAFLFNRDTFENDRASVQVQVDENAFPVSLAYVFLDDLECAPFIQMSQKPPAEVHVFKKLAFNPCQSHGRSIDPEFAFHRVVHSHLPSRRIVARVRRESDPHQSIFHTVVSEEKRVRDAFEELTRLVGIGFVALLETCALLRVFYLAAHAFIVTLPLLRSERLTVKQDYFGQRSLFGFDYLAVLRVLFVFAVETVHPITVIVVDGIQLASNRITDKLGGVAGKWRVLTHAGFLEHACQGAASGKNTYRE